MTGRERVLAAFGRRGEPSWPIDLGGSTVTGIATDALRRLLEARGLPGAATEVDTVQGISLPPPEVLAALGTDTIRIGFNRISSAPRPAGGGVLEAKDQFEVLWRRGPGELYFSQASWPLGEGGLAEALRGWKMPEPDIGRIRAAVEAGKAAAARLGLFPVLDRDCAGLFEMSARLRGLERLYLDMYDEPEAVGELAERLLDYKTRYWSAVLEAWGAEPAALAEGDDYGSDRGLLASPDFLGREYVGRYKRLFPALKARRPGLRVVFHSCGAVRELIPALVEAGVDALNPVQYSAAGMELSALKRDFGKDLVFWGGAVDTQAILPRGSPAEVRAETLRAARLLGHDGGFVGASVHNVQADVPTANLLAFLDALLELKSSGGPA